MTEAVEEQISTDQEYLKLYGEINRDPHNEETWNSVVHLVRNEEKMPISKKGFYGRVPLKEMLVVAKQLQKSDSLEEKYRVLAGRCSTGDLWYDIVLGKANEAALVATSREIGNWKDIAGFIVSARTWERGLDLGTGTGNSLRELEKHAKIVVGIDLFKFLLPFAREQGRHHLATADTLRLPFPDKSFDLIQSHGLTFYLPKSDLNRFISEVDRVLEPGGSYFQAYVLPPDKDGVIKTEREYLGNGKGLLACLMDRLITSPYAESEEEPSEFSLISHAFEQRGYIRVVTLREQEGVVVLEFKKRFPPDFETLKKDFFSGDSRAAYSEVNSLVYGERAEVVKPKNLTEDDFRKDQEIIENLKYLRKLGRDQEVIEFNPLGDYYLVFINPLIYLIESDRFGQNVKREAIGVMVSNLQRISESGRFKKDSRDWGSEGFKKACIRLRSTLSESSECEPILKQIDRLIGENT